DQRPYRAASQRLVIRASTMAFGSSASCTLGYIDPEQKTVRPSSTSATTRATDSPDVLPDAGIEVGYRTIRQWTLKFSQTLPIRSDDVVQHLETSASARGRDRRAGQKQRLWRCEPVWARTRHSVSRVAEMRPPYQASGTGRAADDASHHLVDTVT